MVAVAFDEAVAVQRTHRLLGSAQTANCPSVLVHGSDQRRCRAIPHPCLGYSPTQWFRTHTWATKESLRRPPPFAKVVPGHQAVRVVGLASLSLDPSPTARAWPRPRRHLQPARSHPTSTSYWQRPRPGGRLASVTPAAPRRRPVPEPATAPSSDRSTRPRHLHGATRRGGRWRRGSGRPSPRGPGRRAPPARSRRHPARPAGAGRRRPRRCPGCRCRPRCP